MSIPRVPSTAILSGPPSGRVVSFSIRSVSKYDFLAITYGSMVVYYRLGQFSGCLCGVQPLPALSERVRPLVKSQFRQANALRNAGRRALRAVGSRNRCERQQNGDADGPRGQVLWHRHRLICDGREHPAGPPRRKGKPGEAIGIVALRASLQRLKPVSVGGIVDPALGCNQTGCAGLRDLVQEGTNASTPPPHGLAARQQMRAERGGFLELVVRRQVSQKDDCRLVGRRDARFARQFGKRFV